MSEYKFIEVYDFQITKFKITEQEKYNKIHFISHFVKNIENKVIYFIEFYVNYFNNREFATENRFELKFEVNNYKDITTCKNDVLKLLENDYYENNKSNIFKLQLNKSIEFLNKEINMLEHNLNNIDEMYNY